MFIYKIRNKEGKVSPGGQLPTFKVKGKVWTNLGHVINHLHHYLSRNKSIPDDWEIIEYELIEKKVIKPNSLNRNFLSEKDVLIKEIIT